MNNTWPSHIEMWFDAHDQATMIFIMNKTIEDDAYDAYDAIADAIHDMYF